MESITPYEERLRFPNVVGEGNLDWTGSLANLVFEVSRQSSMIGYDNIFYFYSLTCLIALPVLSLVTVKK
jgi:hypothetical protein